MTITQSKDVESYYDQLSDRYDALTTVSGAWNAPSELRTALSGNTTLRRALVIGAGTGQDIPVLYDCGADEIEAVDLSRSMTLLCQEKFPKVLVHCSDVMLPLSLKFHEFDIVVCSGTSEFIEDLDGLLKKCSRLIVPLGLLYFTFEPTIAFHEIQKNAESINKITRLGQETAPSITTYRRNLFEVLRIAHHYNLELVNHGEYVSYRKGTIDIVYHRLLLRKI